MHLKTLKSDVTVSFLTLDHLRMLLSFDCGAGGEEQTDFARNLAWNFHRNCLSTVYIILLNSEVVSYFTLSPFIISIKVKSDMPEERRLLIEELKRTLCSKIGAEIRYSSLPTILLGQFGVNKKYRGKKIGKEILGRIIIPFAVYFAANIGGIGLSLHANKKVAKKFYLAENPYLPGKFEIISRGRTYELLYPFLDEVRSLRELFYNSERFKNV